MQSSVLEVVSKRGKHLVECLPNGDVGRVEWLDRPVLVGELEVYRPHRQYIIKPGLDVCTCPEFSALLTRGDDEVLLSVLCDRLDEVEPLVMGDWSARSLLSNGYEIWQIWEVMEDEF
jgi:hypothetical protein